MNIRTIGASFGAIAAVTAVASITQNLQGI
jgi:hypothetical protein